MTSDSHVRLSNLTRSFHEGEQLHAVLQSLDATFVRGEKVALRGRSGSGKSTLLNLISGIDVPDDGEVEIDGQLITAMSEREYPSAWQVNVPHLNLQLDVQPVIDDQELNATVRYWEGAVNVSGKRNNKDLGGRGYVELTGYAGIAEPE